MLDDWVEVLSIRFPLFYAFFSVALELLLLVFKIGLSLLSLSKLASEVLFPLSLLLLHLFLELFHIIHVNILSKLAVAVLLFLQSCQLLLPGFLEFLLFFKFLLLFTSSPLNLVLQRFFVLML